MNASAKFLFEHDFFRFNGLHQCQIDLPVRDRACRSHDTRTA
jgi:hypothetical protein